MDSPRASGCSNSVEAAGRERGSRCSVFHGHPDGFLCLSPDWYSLVNIPHDVLMHSDGGWRKPGLSAGGFLLRVGTQEQGWRVLAFGGFCDPSLTDSFAAELAGLSKGFTLFTILHDTSFSRMAESIGSCMNMPVRYNNLCNTYVH